MTNRAELADFLRRRRELLRPADAGLPAGPRRRTPGLRREEVAMLAGVSVDHYTRLEQARGSSPSASVVGAIAGALQCDLDQRDHLFYLAGLPPPARRAGVYVRPGLIAMADRLVDIPVLITTDVGDVVWSNVLGRSFLGSWPEHADAGSAGWDAAGDAGARPRSRNVVWRWFTEPSARPIAEPEWPRISAAHVSDLRAVYARRSGDADVASLVADLLETSAEFRELWERHDVAVHHEDVKTMIHPEVGDVQLRCEILLSPDAGIQLLAFFPLPGTDAAEKLELLRVIGTQEFQPER
ncbi:helix-turn-helix domain-containing protein [Spelaeicoccus albus]|uniref:Transcriptional regulator with XRE-family HTH domain n=1 Tax=Spelaeicoccus albus TaxID=1280376 RepID=A0A7Z0D048_9MICO|nr:helix-turn-helix transcriptional regulator [Spelaeicoccus albus]NYI66909.1 transcriptional regulator with XRE-family HTH domain [Spelaeicoccus albus]